MAPDRRGSAGRTSSETSAVHSLPNVEDVPGRSNSYDDPTESDIEQVMADLMSNDSPFSDLVVSQAYLRAHGGESLAGEPQSSTATGSVITPRSSEREVDTYTGDVGRERKKEQNRRAQRAFRERKEEALKTQSEQIAQLQKDLERANSANESMRDELEQLKGDASGTAPIAEITDSRKDCHSSSRQSADRPLKGRSHR